MPHEKIDAAEVEISSFLFHALAPTLPSSSVRHLSTTRQFNVLYMSNKMAITQDIKETQDNVKHTYK